MLYKCCRGLSSPGVGGLIHWQGARGMTRSPYNQVKDPTDHSVNNGMTAEWSQVCAHTCAKRHCMRCGLPHSVAQSWTVQIQHLAFFVLLKLSSEEQCPCTGFYNGSSSLCCGGPGQANSPNVCLNIVRPLDVWFALAVFLADWN